VAQHNLGLLYEFGYGVPVNKGKARHYYGLAAAQGQVDAQRKLEKLPKVAKTLFSLFRNKK
jgi:TPR repeat protein